MTGTETPSAVGGMYAEFKKLLDADQLIEALELAESASTQSRDPLLCVFALASVAYRQGMIGSAIQLVKEMHESGQDVADTHELLAILYCQAGLLSNALYHSKEATISPPDGRMIALFGPNLPGFSQALANAPHKPLMRSAQAALDRWDVATAIVHVEQHLMVAPDDVEAIDLYANALIQDGRMAKALGMLRSLVTLAGPKPTLLSRIGTCLVSMGRHDQGFAAQRAALVEAPGAIPLWGALAADLVYLPRGHSDAQSLTRQWAECVETKAVKSPRPAPLMGKSDKALVAFLCSQRLSPIEQEMLSKLVGALDRQRFQTLCLGNGELSAKHNVIFRGVFDRWRNVAELDVLTLGALIRGEGVSILIDMDGLRAPAHAGLFLRNCAPLQSAWLNAPAHGPVPGANMHLVSQPRGLPGEVVVPGGRYLCDVVPFSAGPSPSAGGGFCFGADVTMGQITPQTAALWSRVLAAVPGSMLLLRDHGQFAESENVSALIELFGNFGVAHRIDVVAGELQDFCAQVDVMLAPVPHFDVLDAGRVIVSGVPMVVLRDSVAADDIAAALDGSPVAARMLAANAAAFVELAKGWSLDRAGLERFRVQPRQELAGAIGFDAARHIAAFGDALWSQVEDARQKAEK